MSGLTSNSIIAQPAILMVFAMNITVPLGSLSAKTPTYGASST